MKIDDEQLSEFKELYYEQFGVELNDDEARSQARDLLQLMKAVYQPARKKDIKQFLERKSSNPP